MQGVLLLKKRHLWFKTVLSAALLVWGVLILLACQLESSGDSNDSIPSPAPKSVQATPNDGALVLQWTKIAPAQGVVPYYEVWYGMSGSSASAVKLPDDVTPGSSNLVTVTISNLVNFQTYYVWLKAVYTGLGKSDFSQVTYAAPVPPPKTPVNLQITPGEEVLSIIWEEDLYDLNSAAFSYEVYYKAAGSGPTPPAACEMRSVSDPGTALRGLANGTAYRIWIRAVNTAGTSGNYLAGNGTPVSASVAPTSAPTNFQVLPGDTKLTLSWDQVPGVPKYKIYYGLGDTISEATEWADFIPADAPGVTAEITGLSNGIDYFVWVQSWNSKSSLLSSPLDRTNALSDSKSGTTAAKPPINFSNAQFVLGKAGGEFIFAQDLPPSVFWPITSEFPQGGRPNTDRLTRVQETDLGNLFTDGAAWYVRNKLGKAIDFVYLNGGFIDNAIPKGNITVGHLGAISSSDRIMLITLSGAQVKALFDEAADVVHTGRGSSGTGFFGMVSKEVRYTLQYYQPPTFNPGDTYYPDGFDSIQREPYYHGFIKPGTLTIHGIPVVDGQPYHICTTDYLFAYGPEALSDGTSPESIPTLFWRGVAEYIYDQGTVQANRLDGRVKIEGGVPLPSPWVPGDLIAAP